VFLRIADFIGLVLYDRSLRTESKMDDQLIPFLKDGLKLLIYLIALLIALGGILDLDITSLLAGLGIGGLAIAFAAQESIKDLFGSATIFFDKPFTVGDIVKVGDVEGTVERVGFRSTRVRTYDQTFVTIPNKKMVDTNVDNLTARSARRVRHVLRLNYDTSAASLQALTAELRDYFKTHDHFGQWNSFIVLDEFGESSLNLLVIFFIPILDPDRHLELKEEANLKIMKTVTDLHITFAGAARDIRLSNESVGRLLRQ
jgi:MscS family membrane protein